MKKALLLKLLTLSLLGYTTVRAQEWEASQTIHLEQSPTAYSIDTEHNIYIGFANGGLTRYSSSGEISPDYSLPNRSAITLVEAQNNRKIFVFYRDIQQVTVLDRFSSTPLVYSLFDFDVYLANMSCPAPDGNFWTIENNPPRLKKIDPLRKSILLEVQHPLSDSLFFMRTYRNLLLVGDQNGVQVFDQFGSLIGSVDLGKTSYIQILKDDLIATTENGFTKFDPYQLEVLEEYEELTITNQLLFLKSTNELVSIQPKKLVYYGR